MASGASRSLCASPTGRVSFPVRLLCASPTGRLPSPCRFPFEPIIKDALEAGAHGAFLSGAGPTVLAVTGGVGISSVGSDTMSQFLAEVVSDAMVRCSLRVPVHSARV